MNSNWDGIERRKGEIEPTIFDYIDILKKHFKLFLAVFLGILIPAAIFISLQPDIYRAKCVLLYRINNPSYISEQSEIASSHNIISGLERSVYGNISTEGEPNIGIKIEPKRNSGIVSFIYEDKDKDRALLVVKKWVKRYLMLYSMYSKNQIVKNQPTPENILIITQPYLVGKVKPKKQQSIIISLLFSIFTGLTTVLFMNYWEQHKRRNYVWT